MVPTVVQVRDAVVAERPLVAEGAEAVGVGDAVGGGECRPSAAVLGDADAAGGVVVDVVTGRSRSLVRLSAVPWPSV